MVDQNKLSARARRHIQRLCLGNRHMSAASIAAEVEGVGGQPVSAQTIRRTLHQIGLYGCRHRRKPLLKMMHKKAHKQFAEDKQTRNMDYWITGYHVLWSDKTKINLFGSDGVKHEWRQPGEELQFIEGTMNSNMYCDILKQSMISSLRRLGRRAVFQHDNDHCLVKEAEAKDDGLAKHVSRPNSFWASVGHPHARLRSTKSIISTSSVMSSWRSGRGLKWQPVKLWWTPCPRRLRQCWIIVATQYIDTLGHFHLGVYSLLWPAV